MAYKNKYAREKLQQSNDGGITWTDVPNTYRRGRLIEEASDECNTVEWRDVPNSWFCVSDNRLTQWVKDGTECFGNNKYELLKEQESFDGGTTWTDTGSTNYGDLIEANSVDCGYVEVQERWVEVEGEYVCDGYTKYKKEKKQTSTDGDTWVDTTETRTGAFVENNSQYCGYTELTTQWVEDGNYVCDCFDKYAQEKEQVQVNGQWVDNGNTRKGSRVIQQNSEDCGYVQPTPPTPEPEYRMVVVQGEYECVGYDKYTKLKKQVSYDSGETWEDVTPLYTEPGTLIEANSEDCGYTPPTPEPEYRWVNDGYECVGYDKYVKERKQVSYDSGETWSDTGETRLGELIEANSEDCGYVPPTPTPGSGDYLTFTMLENGFVNLNDSPGTLYYSTDEGNTWNKKGTYGNQFYSGDKILFKGIITPSSSGNHTYSDGIGRFSSNGRFVVSGNIMSLRYGDDFVGKTGIGGSAYQFAGLFRGCSKLVSAENLVLPATTLTTYCYDHMFSGCTSLTTAPALPATTLTQYCYFSMFYGCTSLTTAPVLLATTLAAQCYQTMFSGCTSLTTAPVLPATTLADGCYVGIFQNCTSLTTAPALPATTLAYDCYGSMFSGCTSLTTAPDLPATTLYNHCYDSMFEGCSSLNYVKAMFKTNPAPSGSNSNYLYTEYWLKGVAASGTFVMNSAATWTLRGYNGIPSGWSVQTASQ